MLRKKPGNKPKGYPSKKAQKAPRNKSGIPSKVSYRNSGY
jgi:hypothetical protein